MSGAAHGTGARAVDAASVAHDLANVIAVVSAACVMLDDSLHDLPAGHAARVEAERIALAAARAGELCARLRPDIRPTPSQRRDSFDMGSAMREACGLLGPALPHVGIAYEADAPLPVTGVALDAFQIVLNLALNAGAAMGGGRTGDGGTEDGGTVRLRCDAWVADRSRPLLGRLVPGRGYARLTVDDDGPGLPADPAPLFARGASGSGEAGRGTGLATIAAIVERVGGALRTGASPTGGARFELFWPLASERAELAGACVLIVAGASGPTARVADALEAVGAEPSICLDPDDAIASIGEDVAGWDAVVLTGAGRLPDRDGTLARLLAADPAMPLLVVGDRGANEGAGQDGVVAVPSGADGAELLAALSRAIDAKSTVRRETGT